MSDFTAVGWSYWISGIALLGIFAMLALVLHNHRMAIKESIASGGQTTGHSWDEGQVAELNTPLPRWWMIKFVLLSLFALIYLVLYPGLGSFPGLFNYTTKQAFENEQTAHAQQSKEILGRYATIDHASLNQDPAAVAIGQRIFLNNCAVCHGSNAQGGKGFPNLADADWLYGGELANIKEAIYQGRNGVMTAFGKTLKPQQISDVAQYVRSLSSLPHDPIQAGAGKVVFAANCVACHGAEGKGVQAIGAPNLTDKTWLYGSSLKEIMYGVVNGRNNVMPIQASYLTPEQVHLVASYVWGLSRNKAQ